MLCSALRSSSVLSKVFFVSFTSSRSRRTLASSSCGSGRGGEMWASQWNVIGCPKKNEPRSNGRRGPREAWGARGARASAWAARTLCCSMSFPYSLIAAAFASTSPDMASVSRALSRLYPPGASVGHLLRSEGTPPAPTPAPVFRFAEGLSRRSAVACDGPKPVAARAVVSVRPRSTPCSRQADDRDLGTVLAEIICIDPTRASSGL